MLNKININRNYEDIQNDKEFFQVKYKFYYNVIFVIKKLFYFNIDFKFIKIKFTIYNLFDFLPFFVSFNLIG